MALSGRPRKYGTSLSYKKNHRDPDRRKMREIQSLKGWTQEEKDIRRREIANIASKKEAEKQKSLKHLREGVTVLKSKKEFIEFREMINKRNREQLDRIFNDPELMWEIFGDRLDFSYTEIRNMRKELAGGGGDWVSDKEVERAMEIIYGGKEGKILDEDEEDDEDKIFSNPYGELPE